MIHIQDILSQFGKWHCSKQREFLSVYENNMLKINAFGLNCECLEKQKIRGKNIL